MGLEVPALGATRLVQEGSTKRIRRRITSIVLFNSRYYKLVDVTKQQSQGQPLHYWSWGSHWSLTKKPSLPLRKKYPWVWLGCTKLRSPGILVTLWILPGLSIAARILFCFLVLSGLPSLFTFLCSPLFWFSSPDYFQWGFIFFKLTLRLKSKRKSATKIGSSIFFPLNSSLIIFLPKVFIRPPSGPIRGVLPSCSLSSIVRGMMHFSVLIGNGTLRFYQRSTRYCFLEGQSKERVQGTLEVSGLLGYDVGVDSLMCRHQLSDEESPAVIFIGATEEFSVVIQHQ